MSKSRENRKRKRRAHAKLVERGDAAGKRRRWSGRSTGKRSGMGAWARKWRKRKVDVAEAMVDVTKIFLTETVGVRFFRNDGAEPPKRRRGQQK